MRPYILIPYYSSTGTVESLSMYIAKGVEQGGMEARIRRIPAIGREEDTKGPLYVTKQDLVENQSKKIINKYPSTTKRVWVSV